MRDYTAKTNVETKKINNLINYLHIFDNKKNI
jgi:hypothetical protein